MIPVMDRYEAVIFDVDGSLADSMWIWSAIDREYLGRFGLAVPADLGHSIGGLSLRETAYYFKARFGIKDPVDKVMEDWHRMSIDKYRHEIFLKPGAEDLLDFLRGRGIPMAIATSNSRVLAETFLEARGLTDTFACVITGDEVERGKPDPQIYLLAAAGIPADPARCLVFEDIPAGIRAGKAAGMEVCSVYDKAAHGLQKKKEELADYSITDFRDLELET